MTAPAFSPYPFSSADPPTVEDFETAVGVLTYAAEARDALVSGMRGAYVANDRDPLALARGHLRTMARYLAAPDPDEDEDEGTDEPETPTEPEDHR